MLKAIIVDDEVAALEMIKAHLARFNGDIELCCMCSDIDDAVNNIRHYQPDILLLDIELSDGLSFEILERLPGMQAHIIFITAYDHYALKAIKFHAYDYILKPLVAEELKLVLNRVIASARDKNNTKDNSLLISHLKDESIKKIALPVRNGLHYYKIDDIILIEGNGSYASVFLTDDKKITVSKNLKDFELPLTNSGFLRVHKSYLVNVHHIAELHKEDGGYILMSNNKQVPIGSKDKDVIVERIKQHIIII